MFARNFFVSAYRFKYRQRVFSNFLKMVFNFAGCLKHCIAFTSVVIRREVTTAICRGVFIPLNVTQFMFLSSLSLFILWRLQQIQNSLSDLVIGGFLFIARFTVHVSIPLNSSQVKLNIS